MSTPTVTIVFIGIVALTMAVGFLVAWWRDSKNSDEIAADTERLDTAPTLRRKWNRAR
jgi:hypothetical protein